MTRLPSVLAGLLCAASFTVAASQAQAPWGHARVVERTYSKQKVVYDVAVNTVAEVENVLDRASYLSKLNEADPFDTSIVLVLHGDEIPFFAIRNHAPYAALVKRAQSLTVGGVIELRMCRIAAKRRGFEPADIHGFITMVPMADAEIVRLQHEGYAYMR